MKIETQYETGDMVWYMWNSKPTLGKVLNWYITGNNGGKILEYYYVEMMYDSVPVEKLYSTKEQLIASL